MLRRRVIHQPGFTLIEVVTTLSIFAILVALAVPPMNQWISNVKVRTTADTLQNGLRIAQAESLRRSRQVVFSMTNSPNWSINTIPSMTDGSESSELIESGTLTTTTSGVSITGPAAICFNSMGRLVVNTNTGISGANCSALPTGTPPVQKYTISLPSAERSMRVDVGLGGQVHMCDLGKTLSSANPDGCG
jgi:type IV fimbrial biogenesis protein FimT